MQYQINEHIEVCSEVMGGKPVIKGTRLDVETVISHLLAGDTEQEILEAFPFITAAAIDACRAFVSKIAGLKYSVTELKNA